nr:interleukin-7 isoform X2 [Desmodus rotundus]
MFHVSFRYIFGIPPLILVLLPVASSDCEIEGKNGEEYQHIIMVSFKELEHIRENASNCLNNEPNFLKRHSCDDDKEATFLKTAARKLKQFVKMNIREDFKHHLSVVSQGTLKLLNCTRKADLRDSVGLVPDCHNEASCTIIFGFSSAYESCVYYTIDY